MKKLMMMLALGAFCLTASTNVGFAQDTTKTKQDTTKKHHDKKSHDKRKIKISLNRIHLNGIQLAGHLKNNILA
jgi:hypothetical protein